MTTKTNKPAKSLGKFLFKILISDLSRFQRGNWLHYQRCRWRKRPIIWAWLQKILDCILSSSRALNLPGRGTMYLSHPPLVGPDYQESLRCVKALKAFKFIV